MASIGARSPGRTLRALVLAALIVPVANPAPGPPTLSPPQTYGRACATRLGICRIPGTIPPGTPCRGLRTIDDTWIAGVAREWTWNTGPPPPLHELTTPPR